MVIKDLFSRFENKRILYLFPHFDDCAFVSSGLIQTANLYGIENYVAVLSDKMDEVQRREFLQYSDNLKITAAIPLVAEKSKIRESVKRLVLKIKPSLVVTFDPNGITGNFYHRIISLDTYLVLKDIEKRPMLLWRFADREEERYFGKMPNPLGRAYDNNISLRLSLNQSIKKINSILTNKTKTKGLMYKLRIIEWYLFDHYENYYLFDFDRDNLSVDHIR